MPGRPLITLLANGDTIGNTDTTYTKDLPKSNYIKTIWIRFRGTGGASMTEALWEAFVTRIKVESDGGGVIKYLDSQQCRDVAQLRNEMRPDVSIIDNSVRGFSLPLHFTRYEGDEYCLLPAMLFRTLRLELTLSGGQGAAAATSCDSGTCRVDITIDELEAGTDTPEQAKSHLILKEVQRESKATTTTPDFDLPLGNLLRGVLIEIGAHSDNNMQDKWYCALNNGAKIPYTNTWVQMLGENYQQWHIVGYGLEPDGMYADADHPGADESIHNYARAFLWLDEGNTLAHCVDTALYNDVHIKGELNTTQTTILTTLEAVRLA